MINVLWAGTERNWSLFEPDLKAGFQRAGLDVDLRTAFADPAQVDYLIFSPDGPLSDLSAFENVKLVQSTWAGVEAIVTNKTLTQPLARMVDHGLSEGMRDYVVGNVMRHHLNTDRFATAKPGEWLSDLCPPLARDTTVGFLGLGALGLACANTIAYLGFNTLGWSRREKSVATFQCLHGDAGLQQVLKQADIVVTLLPLTTDTENLLNADALSKMKRGASIINPGRGPLIDDDALISALKSGQISQATLDVFRTEPLPADHPYWQMPNVLVTPHVAADTRAKTASQVVVENIRRSEAGDPVLYLVDRTSGY